MDKLASGPSLHPPAGAGDVADVFHETALLVNHDEYGPPGEGIDVGIPAAAGQAQLGIQVVADAGGVDVAVFIHLGPSQEAQVHHAPLGDAEGVVESR